MMECSDRELTERIDLNERRLREPYYRIENVFQEKDAGWPGDKEGRALLAFVCHYKMSGRKIPCMEAMVGQLKDRTDGEYYFGPKPSGTIHEQQLSGHSWLLRGLCEYYLQFHDPRALEAARMIVGQLFLPTAGRFVSYPVDRKTEGGGVSGSSAGISGGWDLSTDVGCAFMSIDGLSQYYEITGEPKVGELLREMTDVFSKIDKVAIRAQTHCSLTAARGMLRLYRHTKDKGYLEKAANLFDLYAAKGMTYTYQNMNWFGRTDSWTEPCAVVDSLMVALELYKITRAEKYRTLAVRIFHNGFSTMQRANGGAGTDSVVCDSEEWLYLTSPEAYFCCTMRLAEGLWYARENRAQLTARTAGGVEKDRFGRYFDGDILYAEVVGVDDFLPFADPDRVVRKDGHILTPILKFYKIPIGTASRIRQRILFR